MPPGSKARDFLSTYTQDLNAEDLGRLFTRETPEAYRFFARGVNTAELEGLSRHRRAVKYVQAFFLAFTMRLSPARRAIYGAALFTSVIGLFELFQGFGVMSFRLPIALFFVRFGVPARPTARSPRRGATCRRFTCGDRTRPFSTGPRSSGRQRCERSTRCTL